ncbi:MAG: arsenate reductase, glutathione/glutaredoxin type [Thermosynechococcaceae cyanobacterium]
MKRMMFVCKHNSRRSHMAEGFARHLGYSAVDSAGLEASQVDPLTVQVMAEVGVDISEQRSQALSDFDPQAFDVVISLCGCGVNLPPEWVSREIFQDWQLDDPAGTSLETFRRVRDEVQAQVELLLNVLE